MTEVVEITQLRETVEEKQSTPKAGRTAPKWEAAVLDRIKSSLKRFQKPLAGLIETDGNEADTRLFVTDFLCDALGYDKYSELCTEYRVKNEYVDYGIRVDKDMLAFVEVKRINTRLGPKHLRQAQSYAVNEGVEWIILTNGAQWQVYHLSGGLPIITDLALDVDLLAEEAPSHKVKLMFNLSREAMKKGKLTELWQAKRATSPKSLSAVLLSPPVVAAVRKQLKKETGYNVSPEEIATLIRTTCLQENCFEKKTK